MTRGLALIVVILAMALPGYAQSGGMQASDAGSTIVTPNAARLMDSITRTDPQQTHSFSLFKKHFKISGPLVYPFKGRNLLEAPKRFVHLLNPFAKSEHPPGEEASERVSTASWSSIAGWSPGRSAFSDAVTHESSLGLSITGGK